ncbi:MAG: enoyl-CoA hydratase/isomerase family protein [Microthrixaceae bacterium]
MDSDRLIDPAQLRTVRLEISEGVATVTLDRPDVYNSFNEEMTEELASIWQALRGDDSVRAVVLTAAGDKSFCTGIDRSTVGDFEFDPLDYDDPGKLLGPKSQGFWKPVIAAVNGMACGGAFYMIGEADIVLAAEHATFFDPHVTYGMVAAYEPILLMRHMPFGEVLRMALTGNSERMGAETACRAGLVSEVVPADQLASVAHDLAAGIAAQPPRAVQATLRTLWAARDLSGAQATDLGNAFLQLGYSQEDLTTGQEGFSSGERIKPRIR